MISPDKINPNDVLCGRGGLTNSHTGNKKYRLIVAEHQLEYLRARKNDKRSIAKTVVSRIREDGGRFLQRSSDSSLWTIVPDTKAIGKTSQALREGLDVRHKTVRPKKYVPKNKFPRTALNTTTNTTKLQQTLLLEKAGVVDTPKIRQLLNETDDVPELTHEAAAATQSFEQLFTFYPYTTIPNNVTRI
jgi:hypothetical protein